MRTVLAAIESEFLRYKALAEGAMRQVDDAGLHRAATGADNSIAVIVRHLSGNFVSRFTDFLTADGEKPWRDRDREFEEPGGSRADLIAMWDEGWRALTSALADLTDADLERRILIRGQPWRVDEALLRSLAHASYHVGQIVFAAKAMAGDAWTSLSIPKGGSTAYNAAPTRDRPGAHAAKLGDPARGQRT
jgi:hypothetical protein